MFMKFKSLFLVAFFLSCSTSHALSIQSADIAPGSKIYENQVFNAFGCSGKNMSPQISWSDVPPNTKSFAFTVYDPDAPTGSGWWHWVVVNIPAFYKELPANFGVQESSVINDGTNQIRNDFGMYKFGGPCPPQGDKPHRYVFTIYALRTDKLDLKNDVTAAFAGFMINRNTIAKASFEARYGR